MVERHEPRRRPQARPAVTILDALNDSNLFGSQFSASDSWKPWRAFLATLFGLPMDDKQRELFRQCTKRDAPDPTGHTEAWLVVGRRGGKSRMMATIAVYLATLYRDWRQYLATGEKAKVMVISQDRGQAKVILDYAKGLLHAVPMLERLVESETAQSITLRNRVVIECHAASFRSTRGFSLVAVLLDELAFFPVDEQSAEPDVEIINAVKPGLGTVPGSMLLCASSPHARRGALWEAYRRHFGVADSRVLAWQAETRTMNSSFPQATVDAALEEDPQRNAAEYLAQFRTDVDTFVMREVVDACISPGVFEHAPLPGVHYLGFVDPSGGSSDSMTLCIAHKEKEGAVIDAIRERRPPFSPEQVTAEFAELLRSYKISKVTGDRYAALWPVERFFSHGIAYEPSELVKSDIYQAFLPLLNSCRVDLLDHRRTANQLCSLERRTARGGRDSIDHPPGQHDDCANAVAGATVLAIGTTTYDVSLAWVSGDDDQEAALRAYRRMELQAQLFAR